MKHVKITKYHKLNKVYVVYLGNGTAHTFSNEVKAKNFLCITSNFLTKNLYSLRLIYSECQNLFNRNWGYFAHNKKTMSSNNVIDERFCIENLRSIEDQFDLVIKRSDFTNGNYFAFQKQQLISRMCKDVILKLDKVHKKKSNAFDRFAFDDLFERLQHIQNALTNYSQREAYELFTLPIHVGDNETEFIPELRVTA